MVISVIVIVDVKYASWFLSGPSVDSRYYHMSLCAGTALRWSWESWLCCLPATTTEELVLPVMGERWPHPHHRCGKAGFGGMGRKELALPLARGGSPSDLD